jgi:hypothetical protein
VLHGNTRVTDEAWKIAGQLIDVSASVRAGLHAAVEARRRRENAARAHDQADRQTIVEERLTDKRQQRVAKAIRSKLQRVGAAERRDLLQACDSSIRADFSSVFNLLVDQGDLVVQGDAGARTLYRLADR